MYNDVGSVPYFGVMMGTQCDYPPVSKAKFKHTMMLAVSPLMEIPPGSLRVLKAVTLKRYTSYCYYSTMGLFIFRHSGDENSH